MKGATSQFHMSLKIISDGSQDIICPHCQHPHGYEWDDGEYNSPEPGMHELECRSCDGQFAVECSLQFGTPYKL